MNDLRHTATQILFLVSVAFTLPLFSQEPKNKAASKDYTIHAKVTLGDGRTVEGNIGFKAPENVIVEHISEGITYKKKVHLDKIQAIEMNRWKSVHVGKNKKGNLYDFKISNYTIILPDGLHLNISDDLFPFLRIIQLENKNGLTVLYTYWRDLKHENGTWYTGISGPEKGERVTPHPDVLKKIEFIK